MMTDIHNLQAFALYMQKTDIKFDLFSVTKEMEKQVPVVIDILAWLLRFLNAYCNVLMLRCCCCWLLFIFSLHIIDVSISNNMDEFCIW